MGVNWFISLIRGLFAFICDLIFGIVSIVYNLLNDIANTAVFSDTINALGKNIYSILGVIMLFKLAFSVITYVIDPDQFTNKENGFSSLIKNIFITIVLILAVPIVFEQAMNLQSIILKEDIVGRVITGVNTAGEGALSNSAGKNMSFTLLSGFIRPNENIVGDKCSNSLNNKSEGIEDCFNALPSDVRDKYKKAVETNSVTKLASWGLVTAGADATVDGETDEIYVFDFNFIIAPLVGGFTAYILLIFCIDIAVRTVKLTFLQLISPIPIVSYIDPKSKKTVFDKWVKVCISTYLDLFIRLAAIYFAVFIIQTIIINGNLQTTTIVNGVVTTKSPNIFVIIFLILGCLMFAKQIPQLISDITGVKMDGKFTLNPIKKIENESLFGKQVASGVGFVGRTAGNLGKATAAGLVIGGGGALLHGAGKLGGKVLNRTPTLKHGLIAAGSAIKTGAHAVGGALSAGASAVGTVADAVMDTPSGKYLSRIGTDFQGLTSGLSSNRDDRRIAQIKDITSAVKNMEDKARERIVNSEAGSLSRDYLRRHNEIERMKNFSLADISQWEATHAGQSYEEYLADEEMKLNEWLNNEAINTYIDSVGKNDATARGIFGVDDDGNAKSDGKIEEFIKNYNQSVSVAHADMETTAKGRHSQSKALGSEQSDIERSRQAIRNRANNK